jgi:PAS domain S-box-containing protein
LPKPIAAGHPAPALLAPSHDLAMSRPTDTSVRSVDLAMVMRISHAIKSEGDLQQLGARLAALAIDHAGAARARFVPAVEVDAELPSAIVDAIRKTHDPVRRDTGPSTSIWIPLHDGDQLLGVLCLDGIRPPLEDHAAVAELIASIAEVALAHAGRGIGHEEHRRVLEEAQRLSHTGSFAWHPATGRTVLSPEACTILGVGAGVDAPRDVFAEFVHPDERDTVLGHIEAAVREQADWSSEHRLVFPDGTVTYLHVVARAVTRPPDDIEYIGAIIDTTAARRAEESVRLVEQARALRAANDRLELALRGSNVGVWDFDLANGGIATAPVYSVNMWESLGYGPELPISRWHPDRWHPDDGPLLRAAIDDHLSGKTPEYELELRFRHADGHYTWHLTRGRAQRRADGTPYRFTGVAIDLTDKKRLEQQLIQAKDAAEAANRAKDMFVANVSHEIRTPLNVILGMTELALDASSTDDQRLSMFSVKSAAENLVVIIDDLLDLAKMEAGKLALTPEPFRIRAIVHDTVRALSVRAHRKKLELVCEVMDDVHDLVVGDAGRLRQVLINLIGNAIKFTERGEVEIRVERAERDSVRFIIRDTGIGIAPEVQSRIFEAFEQADSSTTKRHGGTGLGLTIAARLVALMGGSIDVTSMPGAGSTFAFTARLASAGTVEDAHIAPPLVDAGGNAHDDVPAARRSAQRLRLLVAEDDGLNEQLMCKLLARAGHDVRVARNGREAVALATTEAFDALLLDLHLPEMDGFEVVERIRHRERATGARRLPVIATTARSRREVQDACLAAGMEGFLGKPLSLAKLRAALDAVVTSASPPALVDARTLLAACGHDGALLANITNELPAALQPQLERLARALDDRDTPGLREAAHRVCGLLAPFSTIARDLAGDLEDAAAAREPPSVLSQLVERLTEIVPALLGGLRGITIEDLRAKLA